MALVASAGLASPALAAGQGHGTGTVTVTIAATAQVGTPSGFTLKPGLPVTVTGTGSASPDGTHYTGPNGVTFWCATAQSDFLAPGLPCFALVAKVGDGPWVMVGTGPVTLTGSGPLVFGYNDQLGAFGNNAGAYTATVTYACQPGNGYGDPNHYHCGPPGQK